MTRLVDTFFKRRVLWVTGKGGTGKSTIAAALGLLAAESGLRTLLIDVEARGDVARFLDAGPPRYDAREALPNLYHLAIHPEEVLDEYLRVAMRMPRVRRIGPVRRVFDFVATAAPGIKEVLIAGKIGFEERARNGGPRWDLIVVDAAAAGQVLSHLRGPRTIQEIVQVGMIRNQTAWVRDIIEDPERTGLIVVSLAEEMPVTETEELIAHLPEAVGTPALGIIANRVIRSTQDDSSLAALDGSADLVGPLAVDAAHLWHDLARSQQPDLERLRSIGPPVADVPLVAADHHDLAFTKRVAELLAATAS
ncbi:MAG: ArsA family ATPase [Actinomycetota bacterium]